MGSKTNAFETEFLELLFNNTGIGNVGDTTGIVESTADGVFYIRLYTDAVVVDDATIGTECAYTGYTQYGVSVARTVGGWTVVGNNATNAAAITFDACTGGTETIRYFAIWKTNVDITASNRVFWGQLTSDLAVSSGITPEFTAGDLDVNED